jgi:hypothetical protein
MLLTHLDIIAPALILLILPNYLIAIESPIWAFKAAKRIRSSLALDRDQPLVSLSRLAIFILLVIALQIVNHYTVSVMLDALLILVVVLSLLKVLNALLPPQSKAWAIVTVLDCYGYEVSSSESTTTSQRAVCMISSPTLGVRVFPVISVDNTDAPSKYKPVYLLSNGRVGANLSTSIR